MEQQSEVSDLLNQRAGVKQPAEPTVTNTIHAQSANNFWGNGPEFKEPEKPAGATEVKQEPTAEDPNKKTEAPKPAGLPEKLLRDSAAVTVSAIEMPVKVICGAGLYYQLTRKTKKAFPNPEDAIRAMDLADSDMDPKDELEQRMKKRMLKLVRKHSEKEKALPFTENERSSMEEAWYQKYKIEQKTMSPDTLIISSITAAIGARMFDLFTDW